MKISRTATSASWPFQAFFDTAASSDSGRKEFGSFKKFCDVSRLCRKNFHKPAKTLPVSFLNIAQSILALRGWKMHNSK